MSNSNTRRATTVKQHKHYRFSEMTIQQLDELAAEWKTTPVRVLELLVDRAHADLVRERAHARKALKDVSNKEDSR